MTTLAALHLEGVGTWIGADQQISMGPMRSGPVQKWVVHPSGWAAGAAGYYVTIQLMRQHADKLFKGLKTPEQFADRLRAVLHGGGFMPGSDEPGPISWGSMQIMLASPEGLWDFDPTLGFHQIPPGQIWAAGSGREYAFGAGHALVTHASGLNDPAMVVHAAVEAGTFYDNGSGFEPWVMHLPYVKAASKAVKATAPRAKAAPKRRAR